VYIDKTLDVSGILTLRSSLSVYGVCVIKSTVTINDELNIDKQLKVNGMSYLLGGTQVVSKAYHPTLMSMGTVILPIVPTSSFDTFDKYKLVSWTKNGAILTSTSIDSSRSVCGVLWDLVSKNNPIVNIGGIEYNVKDNLAQDSSYALVCQTGITNLWVHNLNTPSPGDLVESYGDGYARVQMKDLGTKESNVTKNTIGRILYIDIIDINLINVCVKLY
jgi:hypothetical protein